MSPVFLRMGKMWKGRKGKNGVSRDWNGLMHFRLGELNPFDREVNQKRWEKDE